MTTTKITPAQERITSVMRPFMNRLPEVPVGFGFLHIILRNGVRFCMVCNFKDHGKVIAKAEDQVGVDYAYINLD